MTAYYMDFQYGIRIAEISYERETPKMLTGIVLVRDVIGKMYSVPSKTDKSSATSSLADALDKARIAAAKKKDILLKRASEIDKILEEIAALERTAA